MQKQYVRAFALYDRAITLTQSTLGPTHSSLAQHCLNAGIAHLANGDSPTARKFLTRALVIAKKTGLREDGQLYVRIVQQLREASKLRYADKHLDN